ncbi:hypothetical protein VC83_08172 [Pseudogymnoascus destructans]|uniref:Uncharacterized protein n=1 Tax=Pseudogymnoascus destructans TaxID=655981 RepID=A0A176ZZF8_9PEZI|nr:uncharacterized protein VC83_08172 [Pseudogymnoascus destructans]OAF55227.1 hypothetical protein VC83_08172 [Pseudogymnoascus destructans]
MFREALSLIVDMLDQVTRRRRNLSRLPANAFPNTVSDRLSARNCGHAVHPLANVRAGPCVDPEPTFQHSSIPVSIPAFQHSSTPALQHSSTPAFQHSSTPAFQHSSTPAFQHSSTPATRPVILTERENHDLRRDPGVNYSDAATEIIP